MPTPPSASPALSLGRTALLDTRHHRPPGSGDFWLQQLRKGHEELVASWEIRTSLSDAEAKQWATIAAAHQREPKVWVCFFHDGTISATPDPKTGAPGCSDWSFELIRILSLLVAHRAELVYTADDAFNPLLDEEYSGYVWPSPGPGMFAEMLKKIMYPLGRDKVHCCGKGGNEGRRYMLERAIEMLRAQGHDGDRSKIMIVGDRFDTDIRGGRSVAIKTCLVESGCHTSELQHYYPADQAHFVAPNLRAMLPEPEESPHGLLPHFVDRRLMLRAWMLSQGNMIYFNNTNSQVPESLRRLLREYYDFVTNMGQGVSSPLRRISVSAVVEVPLPGFCLAHSPPAHTPVRGSAQALEVLGIVMEPEAVRARLQARGFSEPINFDAFSSIVAEALKETGIESSLCVSPARSLRMVRRRKSARDSGRHTRAKTLPIEELARAARSFRT